MPKSIAENSSSAMKAAMATVFPQLPITEAHIDFSLRFLLYLYLDSDAPFLVTV
jgi:hypothetical protein